MPKSLRKVVVDTSALISFALGGLLERVAHAFHVVVSQHVIDELQQTASFPDEIGKTATSVLKHVNQFEIRIVNPAEVQALITSRIDRGEASCLVLAQAKDVSALISDDFRALHQLRHHAERHGFNLGLGAVLIHTLVLRGTLSRDEALNALERIALKRDWFGRPIYLAYRARL